MALELKAVIAFITVLTVNHVLGIVVGVPTAQILLAGFAVLAVRHHRRIYIIIRTLPRDLRIAKGLVAVLWSERKIRRNNQAVCHVFSEQAKRTPDAPIIHFNEETWTNRDVEVYSNRVANAFLRLGYKKGDVVALLIGNCPEQVCLWLGLSKLGVVTALINFNLRNQPLKHCINVVQSKAIIYSPEYAQAIEEVRGDLDSVKLFQLGGDLLDKSTDLKALIAEESTEKPDCPQPGNSDKLVYIFTSGTTGMPKAAVVPNCRYILLSLAAIHLIKIGKDDCVYSPLPLYHTAGGNLGLGPALMAGARVVLRSKFSASSYFPDCAKYKCTVGQYIGEMCRYIMAVPPGPNDKKHNLRVMFGNGMRIDIWEEFVNRFAIPALAEIYGATEGNASIVNLDNKVGAVGFKPCCLPQWLYPVCLVKADLETGEILRGKDGLCMLTDTDEPGMYLGLINNRDPTRVFHGYADKEASEKKIVRNVLRKGDMWFNSGDILSMDEMGYMYFKDRTGDTFRWKGENVSTAEVEAVIVSLLGPRTVAVYGVEVPKAEGRAGMAALASSEGDLDLDALAKGLDKELPSYARPLFLRVAKQLEMTGTFKIKKVDLIKQGYNRELIKDPLYVRTRSGFVPLTPEVYQDIIGGKMHL